MKTFSLLLVALLSAVGCSKSMGDGAMANDLTQPAPPPPKAKVAPAPLPTVQRVGVPDDGVRPVAPKTAPPLPTVSRGGVPDDSVRPKGPVPVPAPTAR